MAIVAGAIELKPVMVGSHFMTADSHAGVIGDDRSIDIDDIAATGAYEMLVIVCAGLESREAFAKIQLFDQSQLLKNFQGSIDRAK
jgi:hypothetical protein